MEEHHDLHEEVLEVGCHGELGDVVVVVGVGHLAEDVEKHRHTVTLHPHQHNQHGSNIVNTT